MRPPLPLPRFSYAHENFAPHQSAREQSTNFFSGTYHISFTPTSDGILRSLCETALRHTATRAEPTRPTATGLRRATPYGPVIPHSYTYATLLRDKGERQSGSNVEVPNTVPWHAEHGISVLEMSLL